VKVNNCTTLCVHHFNSHGYHTYWYKYGVNIVRL